MTIDSSMTRPQPMPIGPIEPATPAERFIEGASDFLGGVAAQVAEVLPGVQTGDEAIQAAFDGHQSSDQIAGLDMLITVVGGGTTTVEDMATVADTYNAIRGGLPQATSEQVRDDFTFSAVTQGLSGAEAVERFTRVHDALEAAFPASDQASAQHAARLALSSGSTPPIGTPSPMPDKSATFAAAIRSLHAGIDAPQDSESIAQWALTAVSHDAATRPATMTNAKSVQSERFGTDEVVEAVNTFNDAVPGTEEPGDGTVLITSALAHGLTGGDAARKYVAARQAAGDAATSPGIPPGLGAGAPIDAAEHLAISSIENGVDADTLGSAFRKLSAETNGNPWTLGAIDAAVIMGDGPGDALPMYRRISELKPDLSTTETLDRTTIAIAMDLTAAEAASGKGVPVAFASPGAGSAPAPPSGEPVSPPS